MLLQKFIDNADHPPAQTLDRGELPHVDTGQLLRQHRLIAGGQAPVGKVVGESLADEVVFLQSAERVLEDRIIGASLQRLPQFAERGGLLPSDSQQVLRCVEVKRFVRLVYAVLVSNRHGF